MSAFPLIDLHRHLDGNVRIQSIIALANKHNVVLPSTHFDTLSKYVHIQDKTSDLLAFLQKLDLGVSVLGDLDACNQIAYENVQDAISEGLHHVELRFSPRYMSQAFDLPMQGVVEAVVDGIRSANKDFQYNAKLIGILSRTYGADKCEEELQSLLALENGVVAVDLAGDEKGYPAALFTTHFNKVKDAGLKITIHAGEAEEANSIWDAIHLLHADRIGHGVSAYKDAKLMDYLAKHQIGVETCILSNYQTATWTNIPQHPVKAFIQADVPVCLNTDDPGISNNSLQSEYQLARTELKLSDSQINTLKLNALHQAFLTDKEKDAILASL